MQIQVNTGHNIEMQKDRAAEISGVVESSLSHYSDHITRVEIHLSDENSDKKEGYEDMRCMLEARLKGSQPIAVKHQAESLDLAISGAADKLVRLLESTIGRRREQQRRRADPDPSEPDQELAKEL
ncbi:Sigma 54 modulation protein / S30EA ribosomal protein [Geoalkalibacter ferrihydriticus]|uniref:Ribosomal subunit interface protein n=2 Tax=Geoalkalibacter ferrihydriticus TaxID=392333 RepID=A0A0C2EED4_9BACT|nr:HPF/RaiA family ribosome-associated protein [Geoalkalibacter ferrihydriticus]KIH76988.1 ribosomal subunit interface protein [Geoalkalibacter ferrihydriticus DSM 17813]SDL40635.1 Sigma 54 modulation protein / S30EA ribosomal protein [Geoalkalibacter ferrihydriticus]